MKKFKNAFLKYCSLAVCLFAVFLSLNFLIKYRTIDKQVFAENQIESSNILKALDENQIVSDVNYSLTYDIVIDGENQLTTDFCWLFSSLTCLESSLALKRGEYYNFSEAGMAYLNYLSKIESGTGTFNSTGNMLTLVNLASNKGLILENDVSNDLLTQINEENYKNYRYISDLADKNLFEGVKLVSLGSNPYFLGLDSYNKKIELMQKFIKEYGALFLAFGDGDGVVFKTSGIGQYSFTSEGHEYDRDVTPMNNHAICLIGWNGTGFIAQNSWGDGDAKYQTFCIPYDDDKSNLSELMKTARGFVVDDNSLIKLERKNEQVYENVFNLSNGVDLVYTINEDINLNETRLEIFKGTQDVTFDFNVEFDNNNSKIKIYDRFSKSAGKNGGYVVRFFVDDKLISTKTFVILAGSEIENISLERNGGYSNFYLESWSMSSGYLTDNLTTTYLLNPYSEYRLRLNLSSFSKCKFDETDPNWSRFLINGQDNLFNVSTVKVLLGENYWKDTEISIKKEISYDLNSFIFTIPKFSDTYSYYQNKILNFEIEIGSTIGENVKTTINIFFFVGELDGSQTNQNFSIHYEMNGGKNSEKNITNYPNYQTNANMTEFILQTPTKSGYEFLGWFSDSKFTNQISKISNEFYGDIVLYAKWDSADIEEYIKTSISILSILNSDNTEKNLNSEIEYGDTVWLKYDFVPQGELLKYNYSARLIAYYNYGGQRFYIDELNNKIINAQTILRFSIAYPTLKYGTYKLVIDVDISINNVATIRNSAETSFLVNKRNVNLEFSNLSFIYDAESHFPTVTANQADLLNEDKNDFGFIYSIPSQTKAGQYTFLINLKNQNYKIAFEEQSSCRFEILPKKLDIVWTGDSFVYNGTSQTPSFVFVGLEEGDYTSADLKNKTFENVGQYTAEIDATSLSNSNYYILNETFDFEITPAKLIIDFDDIEEVLLVAPEHRAKITFSITGDMLENANEQIKSQIIDSLNLNLISEGITATKQGQYAISATYYNENYDVTFIEGIYTINAGYKVVYRLPDGTIYQEFVDEGEQPKGISRDLYNHTIFQKLEYSQELKGDGTENLYVTVTLKDYTIYVIAIGVAVVLIITYLIITRKQRRNKVS